MTDFKKLEKEIYAAAKIAFRELVERSHPEPLCAFALYSDEGAMTVCPAANTEAHLATARQATPDFAADCKFSPAEWAYESVGADALFDAICRQLSARLDNENEDEQPFELFRSDLFTACGNVLRTLKAENFFDTTADRPIMLLFAVSDADITAREAALVRVLNDTATGDEYEQWAQTVNEL